MVKNSGIIEINGNRYDAVSGQLIGAVKRVASQVKPAGVIDGFIKKPSGGLAPRQPQRSRTLMRGAVAKYAPVRGKPSADAPKARSQQLSAKQALRAKLVPRNDKVKRFGGNKGQALEGQVLPSSGGSGAASSAQAMPSLVANVSHRRLERLLDEALWRADSHRDQLRRQLAGNNPWARFKLLPKWMSVGASLLVVLLLGGFFAWQNVPQVSMRLAASKAHVSAAVPSYAPAGFKASPASANNDAVKIQYQAASDTAQKYTISQQTSNWDSSTLASTVNSQDAQVQTSQVNGTTVYIYGQGNNASWVDHGVLHTLNDQAGLTSDQILKIAGSMQ